MVWSFGPLNLRTRAQQVHRGQDWSESDQNEALRNRAAAVSLAAVYMHRQAGVSKHRARGEKSVVHADVKPNMADD